ncbi:hypothetical protein HS125_16790 [bacterium]|nr:hypothetical protein [bacterium]
MAGHRPTQIGLDAVDVEGVDAKIFDTLAHKAHFVLPEGSIIFFSFEEVNEEYICGPGAGPFAGLRVSADDQLAVIVKSGVYVPYAIMRTGADGVPAGVPNVFTTWLPLPNLGLDAIDWPNSPFSNELGETGPVFDHPHTLLFSTSLDDPLGRFAHGDLLAHGPGLPGGNFVVATNAALTSVVPPTGVDYGLDALDCVAGPVDATATITPKPTATPTPTPRRYPVIRVGGAGALLGGEGEQEPDLVSVPLYAYSPESIEFARLVLAWDPRDLELAGLMPDSGFGLIYAATSQPSATQEYLTVILAPGGGNKPSVMERQLSGGSGAPVLHLLYMALGVPGSTTEVRLVASNINFNLDFSDLLPRASVVVGGRRRARSTSSDP